jgi:predicted Zn-dependent protease
VDVVCLTHAWLNGTSAGGTTPNRFWCVERTRNGNHAITIAADASPTNPSSAVDSHNLADRSARCRRTDDAADQSLLLNSHRQKTPVTHRTQHVGLTDEQQAQLGSQQYANTLRKGRKQVVFSGAAYVQVQRVAKRIEAVASRDKPDFVWKVTLLRKNEANAYCLPGGKIVVYTGILPLTRTDAGLATVLGHEVSHATAEHAAERIERQHLTRVAAAIIAGGVAITPGQYARVIALLGAGGAAASLPFSRSQESEADHIGLIYMAKAGYDPRQAVAFWKRMQRASSGKQPPEFASDHPSDRHRVAQIRKWLPEAERAYKPAQ